MPNKSSVSSRYRNFATVVYPDSAPDNWQDILSEQCIPCFVSPLHEFDVNPDGEVKKAHFHVLFAYDGKKSLSQVQQVVDLIGGVGCEVVQSLRGYARYLCHLDNPEKHQYSVDDVLSFGGADYHSTIGLPTDKYKAIREMIEYCDKHGLLSYADLLLYASVERYDWFRILCDSGTVVMKEYLKSRSWSLERHISSNNVDFRKEVE